MTTVRALLATVAVCFAVAFIPIVNAQEEWVITNFVSDITIQETGSVVIQETIAVDFGSLEKHGIFRDIPYVYTDEDSTIHTPLVVDDVQMDTTTIPYVVSKNDGYVNIKIGDPDVTISGRHSYTITYTVTGVLVNHGSFDELYWNVTGGTWPVPIINTAATVSLPHQPNLQTIQSACYRGSFGSDEPCKTVTQTQWNASFSDSLLNPSEGLTIAVGYTPGIISTPHPDAPPTIGNVLQQPVTWLLALTITIVGGFVCLRLWWTYGRDRFVDKKHLHDTAGVEKTVPLFHRETISVEYDAPDRLKPAEIGTIIDETADTLDVAATIVDLAIHGYLTITEQPKTWFLGKSDYTLTRTSKAADALLPYESLLLKKLFSGSNAITISSLKNTFYEDLESIKESIYKTVQDKKIFPHHPHKRRTYSLLISIGIIVVGTALIMFSLNQIKHSFTPSLLHAVFLGTGIGVAVTGILGLLFAPFMSQRTAYGRELYRRIVGYKLFVSGTEKYRQPFFEKQNLFMDVLPYAMVFGVTEKLAKAMADMGIKSTAPGWYIGTTPFNMHTFSNNVSAFSTAMASTMASKPSSSGSGGGGSSGGGFGGGGGGSW